MIAVVDYGMGNLRSVAGAVRKVGFDPVVTGDPDILARADKLILPGVGAFGDAMRNLRDRGLADRLDRLVLTEKKPILGICLGCQLMAKTSEEFGRHDGLGWIDADVRRLDGEAHGLRVPHVGWNDCFRVKDDVLFDGAAADILVYFVHSFHVVCHERDIVVAESEYGIRFTAAFRKGNIYGTQFHPEKSQLGGLGILKNFLTHG
jgi:glutamine amidotransferase